MPLLLLLSLQDVTGDVHYVLRALPWAMETIGLSARCCLCIYSVFAVIEYLCDLSWLGRKIVTLSLWLLGTHVREYKENFGFSLYSAHLIVTLYPKYEKDEETLY